MTQLKNVGSSELKRKQGKTKGFVYQGKDIPLHAEDALALLQVRAAFEFGETATVIAFSNGVNLPMAAPNFSAFAAQFVAARNAFYKGL